MLIDLLSGATNNRMNDFVVGWGGKIGGLVESVFVYWCRSKEKGRQGPFFISTNRCRGRFFFIRHLLIAVGLFLVRMRILKLNCFFYLIEELITRLCGGFCS